MTVADNIAQIKASIADAATAVGREPEDITLLAVSKKQSIDKIREAYAAGQVHFGENYLQEALEKMRVLSDLNITWHFIGHVQSNKTKLIAENFSWVHSVDRLKIAQRLSEQRSSELPPLNLCVEININNEAGKAGITLDELPALIADINKLPNITLRGLMAIPDPSITPEKTQQTFARLAEALQKLNQSGFHLDTLSMGMSADFKEAIAAGSTMVRVGTAIFGARS